MIKNTNVKQNIKQIVDCNNCAVIRAILIYMEPILNEDIQERFPAILDNIHHPIRDSINKLLIKYGSL